MNTQIVVYLLPKIITCITDYVSKIYDFIINF